MTVLGYLPKLKKGLGILFGAIFPHDFFIKVVLITLSFDSFNVVPFFPSQDIKQNVLLSSY